MIRLSKAWRLGGFSSKGFYLMRDLAEMLGEKLPDAAPAAWVYHPRDSDVLPGFYLGWENGADTEATLARSKAI
jgi:hypothetical protein